MEIPQHRPKDSAQFHQTLFPFEEGGVWVRDYTTLCLNDHLQLQTGHRKSIPQMSLHQNALSMFTNIPTRTTAHSYIIALLVHSKCATQKNLGLLVLLVKLM